MARRLLGAQPLSEALSTQFTDLYVTRPQRVNVYCTMDEVEYHYNTNYMTHDIWQNLICLFSQLSQQGM